MTMFLKALIIILFMASLFVFVKIYKHHIGILKNDSEPDSLKGHVRQHLYIINFSLINAMVTVYVSLRDIGNPLLDYTNMSYYNLVSLSSTIIFGGIHYINELKTEEDK